MFYVKVVAVVTNISYVVVSLEKICTCSPAEVQDAEAGNKLQAVETQLCGLQGVQHLVEVNLVQFQLSEEIKFTCKIFIINQQKINDWKKKAAFQNLTVVQ